MKKRYRIKNNWWFNFWYRYNYPKFMTYGGNESGYYSFRHERLIYTILVILIFFIIFV